MSGLPLYVRLGLHARVPVCKKIPVPQSRQNRCFANVHIFVPRQGSRTTHHMILNFFFTFRRFSLAFRKDPISDRVSAVMQYSLHVVLKRPQFKPKLCSDQASVLSEGTNQRSTIVNMTRYKYGALNYHIMVAPPNAKISKTLLQIQHIVRAL